MSTFKPFYIRVCTQCKDPQPLKCGKCVKHPNRKPKVIEVYAPPMATKICECRLSFQFQCQRDGCTKLVWRSKTSNSRAGMVYAKKLFCSIECRMAQMHIGNSGTRAAKIEVECSWCHKKFMRLPSRIRTENIFCNKSEIKLFRAKQKHDARQTQSTERDFDSPATGLIHCACCRDVTEHQTPPMDRAFKAPLATCLRCGVKRPQELGAAALNRDAQAIRQASARGVQVVR